MSLYSWLKRRTPSALKAFIRQIIPLRPNPKILPKGATIQSLTLAKTIGELESVEQGRCKGWAVHPSDPNRPVTVDIVVCGIIVATQAAEKKRPDIAKILGSDGRHGFAVKLPPGLDSSPTSDIVARCHETGFPLALTHHNPRELTYKLTDAFDDRIPAGSSLHLYSRRKAPTPTVCIIIINRNGADDLERLFASFSLYNSYRAYEFVVVDHNSHDSSIAVCRKWKRTLNIRVEKRDKNYSFSESNNFAARDSAADLILFLNNDIVFCQDILPSMASYLDDQRIGALGVRLLSPPEELGEFYTKLNWAQYTQHLGIKFSFNRENRPFFYYEVPLNEISAPTAHSACWVPAVTAACMMMRRDDFERAGGYHEGYFYGCEDIDLCLSVFGKTGKKAVCANDIVAVHHKSTTRGKASASERARIAENKGELERRFGKILLGVRHHEWLADNIFFQNDRPKVAFLVARSSSTQQERMQSATLELGQALLSAGCREVAYLEPSNWERHRDADVVISLTPEFDPRQRFSASPYQIMIAWPNSAPDKWLQIPRNAFDDVWCTNNSMADALSHELWCRPPVYQTLDMAGRLKSLGRCLRIAVSTPLVHVKPGAPEALAALLGLEIVDFGHRVRQPADDAIEGCLKYGDDALIDIGAPQLSNEQAKLSAVLLHLYGPHV
ncbi:hypothetical protein AUC70_03305 [Methyloceanibacter stevinii]|uniref:Glycosyltransferase 2-like domain-containing protein n=1 Tax=Methyloceanibacter stevinii TaxID=1774970 RepID=A0A1E3VQU3_9HYPH|nr:glycosyltransferase family 2 protein [Methyloceanibacter stevinii]ODR95898.1 hypothetical protein AUC70_03305 [Methyloceanibacter stevinii]